VRRDRGHDFDRLEKVVTALVEAHQQALVRNEELRGELDEKNQRIRQLESKLLDVNQRRQDVTKRIEELIAQIDQLDAELDAQSAKPAKPTAGRTAGSAADPLA